MKPVSTDMAPAPAGHYSQGMRAGNLLFVSGQLPIEPGTGAKVTGPIGPQALQALKNVAAIVQAAGLGLEDVAKTTVYVSDIAHWDEVNQVYAEFFGDHKPARAVVPVRELHFGFQVEIEAVAVFKE